MLNVKRWFCKSFVKGYTLLILFFQSFASKSSLLFLSLYASPHYSFWALFLFSLVIIFAMLWWLIFCLWMKNVLFLLTCLITLCLFTHAQCCSSGHEFAGTIFLSTWFTALTLFYDVKRGIVVKVRYEINGVITAWRRHGHIDRGNQW